jgi:hypothetical protein
LAIDHEHGYEVGVSFVPLVYATFNHVSNSIGLYVAFDSLIVSFNVYALSKAQPSMTNETCRIHYDVSKKRSRPCIQHSLSLGMSRQRTSRCAIVVMYIVKLRSSLLMTTLACNACNHDVRYSFCSTVDRIIFCHEKNHRDIYRKKQTNISLRVFSF